MNFTSLFHKNSQAFFSSDLIINQGGARAGKTYAILQMLLLIAYKSNKNLVISVVSQTIPHLKKGAIRDFKNICYSFDIPFEQHFNKSELTFQYNNTIIEFFSADNAGKVHGSARDILFVNECNYISYEIFEHLEIRTADKIILDFNPLTKFWVHTEIIDKNTPHSFIHSTYKDNEFLSPKIVTAIERKRHNENWWQVYGLGNIGFSEEIVFNENKMKRFESYNRPDGAISVSYTDVAYGGGDYFCTVFADVFDNKVYIHDVIFNKNSIDINEELLLTKLQRHKTKYYAIETNGGAIAFGKRIKKVYGNKFVPINNRQNKATRIIDQAVIIIDNFHFKKDLVGEYSTYFNQLTSFNIDLSKNKNDDAPDATAGLAYFLTFGLKMFLEYYK
jgi:PBSX family phage terminase large subunit